MLKRLAGILSLGLALVIGVGLVYGRERLWARFAPADLGDVDFASVERSSTSNDALAATPGTLDGAEVGLPRYLAQPTEVMARLLKVVRADGGEIVQRSPTRLRVVTRSPFMRFPDTTVIELVPLDGGTGIRAYARASIGHSDFGANAARLRRWLGDLDLPADG